MFDPTSASCAHGISGQARAGPWIRIAYSGTEAARARQGDRPLRAAAGRSPDPAGEADRRLGGRGRGRGRARAVAGQADGAEPEGRGQGHRDLQAARRPRRHRRGAGQRRALPHPGPRGLLGRFGRSDRREGPPGDRQERVGARAPAQGQEGPGGGDQQRGQGQAGPCQPGPVLRHRRGDRPRAGSTARGPVARIAEILAFLEPWIQAEFAKARREGRHERRGAYAFDALAAALRLRRRLPDRAAGRRSGSARPGRTAGQDPRAGRPLGHPPGRHDPRRDLRDRRSRPDRRRRRCSSSFPRPPST